MRLAEPAARIEAALGEKGVPRDPAKRSRVGERARSRTHRDERPRLRLVFALGAAGRATARCLDASETNADTPCADADAAGADAEAAAPAADADAHAACTPADPDTRPERLQLGP